MIGIRFEIPNKWDKVLNKILYNVASSNDYWIISNDEVHISLDDFLFKKEKYSYVEFNEVISKEDYYPVHLKLELYSSSDNNVEIKNYDDYENSNCKLLITIVDVTFVDIFSKDEEMLKQIKYNAETNRFGNIEIISKKPKYQLM